MTFYSLLESITIPILQFFSVQDVIVLAHGDPYIDAKVLSLLPSLTFYGYRLPTPMDRADHLFYDVFFRRYHLLEQKLIEHQDEMSLSRYGFNASIRKRLSSSFVVWNEMTLLEIAYLLHDDHAITLLEQHGRTICHDISSYTSTFGKRAITLAVQAEDTRVVAQLWSNIHIWNQESLQREYPMVFGHLVIGR